MNNNKEISFESSIEELDKIVKRLESGELPLEEALSDFEKGITLAKQGQERLKHAEQKIKILLEKGELDNYSDTSF